MSSSTEAGPVSGPSAEELARFTDLGRRMSTTTVLIHSRIGERIGLSSTDYKCMELAMRSDEPRTAGQIAELSGLSTGAVTGVIDRLERAGFVRRVRDPHDRRKVLVEVSRSSVARLATAFEGLAGLTEQILADFDGDERAVIERYLVASLAAADKELERLSGKD